MKQKKTGRASYSTMCVAQAKVLEMDVDEAEISPVLGKLVQAWLTAKASSSVEAEVPTRALETSSSHRAGAPKRASLAQTTSLDKEFSGTYTGQAAGFEWDTPGESVFDIMSLI